MVPTGAVMGQSAPSQPITLAAVSGTASPTWLAPHHQEAADAALTVLTDVSLDRVVDMVLSASDGMYEARSHDGAVQFRREGTSQIEVVATEGRDPLADQATDKFSPLAAERAQPHPDRSEN